MNGSSTVLLVTLGAALAVVASAPPGWSRTPPPAQPSWMLQLRAVEANTQLRSEQKVSAIVDLLKSQVADTGAGGREPESPSALSPREQFEQAAIRAVGHLGTQAEIRAVGEAPDAAPKLRLYLLMAYATAFDTAASPEPWPEAITELMTALGQATDDFVRSQAAQAVGELGATEAVEALVAALSDPAHRDLPGVPGADNPPHYLVRQAAALALARLGHEVERVDWGTWVIDRPLITGIDASALLDRLGVRWDSRSVGVFGVTHQLAAERPVGVTVGVFSSLAAAQQAWTRPVMFDLPGVPGAPRSATDIGESRGWLGRTGLGFRRRNVICIVADPDESTCIDLARRADALLEEGQAVASWGRPVPTPEVGIDAPQEVAAGRSLRLPWRVVSGDAVLFGWGSGAASREGTVMLRAPTADEPQVDADLVFATERCVVVRKPVCVRVVPPGNTSPGHQASG